MLRNRYAFNNIPLVERNTQIKINNNDWNDIQETWCIRHLVLKESCQLILLLVIKLS